MLKTAHHAQVLTTLSSLRQLPSEASVYWPVLQDFTQRLIREFAGRAIIAVWSVSALNRTSAHSVETGESSLKDSVWTEHKTRSFPASNNTITLTPLLMVVLFSWCSNPAFHPTVESVVANLSVTVQSVSTDTSFRRETASVLVVETTRRTKSNLCANVTRPSRKTVPTITAKDSARYANPLLS